MAKNGIGASLPQLLLYGALGAGAGAIGTLAIQRLLPEAKPGDGFSVRWLDTSGAEKRLDFGDDEGSALRRAIELAQQLNVSVEVIEIRQGRIARIQRPGQKEQVVA